MPKIPKPKYFVGKSGDVEFYVDKKFVENVINVNNLNEDHFIEKKGRIGKIIKVDGKEYDKGFMCPNQWGFLTAINADLVEIKNMFPKGLVLFLKVFFNDNKYYSVFFVGNFKEEDNTKMITSEQLFEIMRKELNWK